MDYDYGQFKDLDVGGKLNILFSLITNHLKSHAKREKVLFGIIITLSVSTVLLVVRSIFF